MSGEIRTLAVQLIDGFRDDGAVEFGAALVRLAPLLKEELGIVLLEAAEILGDPSLVPDLKEIEQWEGGGERVIKQLRAAIAACEAEVGVDSWPGDDGRFYCLSEGN